MIFFTADLHFGHANVIKHCSRPFANVVEMDDAILAAINMKVRPTDTLWVLGDFAFRGRDPKHYREQINCQDVRLLLGNHDKRVKSTKAGFKHVGDVAEISVGKQRIWLSHYAHRSWPASHRGSWHLYGHSHGALNSEDESRNTNALDVGVDNFQSWAPWSVDEVARVLPRLRKAAEPPPPAPRPEWLLRPYWVDPPSGWRYGFPRLYDPSSDGNVTDWMIRHGYPEHLARKGLSCSFTAATEEDLNDH
jgi:calcineurin-like phosphoesterase family protein